MSQRWLGMALVLVAVWFGAFDALAQTSSLGARKRQRDADNPPPVKMREAPEPKLNPIYERYSWISTIPLPPQTFEVNDLLTIIVRQNSKYEADADLETKKGWQISSDLDEFIKFTDGGIGSAMFRRGQPNIDYRFRDKHKGEGDTSRRDKLTTRLTAKVIDVKPNGVLVVEATGLLKFDDESSRITVTGMCRKEDVTADNTILSTQIASLEVKVHNAGALRKVASRGWLLKLLDMLRPI